MSIRYFEQHDLWNRQPEKYQLQTHADVLSMIPEKVTSILDAGCGDGFLTNDLPKDMFVVGTDLSREALRYVSRSPIQASVDFLPFAPRSFDLVMVNDTIEHIPPADLDTVLANILRVARKYILVTVPYAEDVQAYQCKCVDCGHVYHVNHHYRSLDISDLEHIFGDDARLVEIRYSGDIVRQSVDPTTDLRHKLHKYVSWQSALCPNCGSPNQIKPDGDSFLSRMLDVERSKSWITRLWDAGPWNMRTEVIALYVVDQHELLLEELEIPCVNESLLKVRFNNSLQEVAPDFIIGSPWARFLCPRVGEITSEGMVITPERKTFALVPVKIPVIPEVGDKITLDVTGVGKTTIGIYGYDGLLWREIELKRQSVSKGSQHIEYVLTDAFALDRCGFPLYLYVYGPVVLRELNYIPQNLRAGKIPRAEFAQLQPGHSVIRRHEGQYWISWGFSTPTEGIAPLSMVAAERYKLQGTWKDVEEIGDIVDNGFLYLASRLNKKMSQFQDEQIRLQSVQQEFQISQRDLKAVRKDLEAMQQASLKNQQELLKTRQDLQRSQENLLKTRQDLQRSQEDLLKNRQDLQTARKEIQAIKQDLNEARAQIATRTGIKGGVREVWRSMKSKLFKIR